ncbi:vitelline membrane outer layer protein 1-like [Lacerta agilis]|uniref:vitelline membrane outer layer protein 1-like n=1 Tax=Lacerta agilis TaxID=80427 RepID=UPI001419BF8D|nr:vitelline membrane outer layer protein 1-like [Lacerta agilis]
MDLPISAVVFLFLSYHLGDAEDRKHSAVLTVTNGGKDGTWGKPEFCPTGYANGFQMKVRKDVNEAFRKDFTLKGIRLHCTDGKTVESKSGKLGEWTEVQRCPNGNMVSFSLTIELPHPLTPHAVTNLEVLCSGGAKVKKDIFKHMEEGRMSKHCPSGFICGIQTRVANENQMLGKVELRDVKMFCCD